MDIACDTSDLAACAGQMHVYIPLHISGEGVNRQLTRSASASAAAGNNRRKSLAAARHLQEASEAAAAATAASDPSTEQHAQQPQQQQQQEPKKKPVVSHLSRIPENFPIPAECSLEQLRSQLETLTRSQVFLGFVDNVTGGLVELRESTLEQFCSVPDQHKAIHCRLLRQQKSKTEKILEAVQKRRAQQQQQQQEGSFHNSTTNSASNTPVPHSVLDVGAGAASSASPHTRKQQQADLIARLSTEDIRRREIKRKQLERAMYPQEDDPEPIPVNFGGRSTPSPATATVSASAAQHPSKPPLTPQPTTANAAATGDNNSSSVKRSSSRNVRSKREIEEYINRLNDTERVAARKASNQQKARQQMIDEGYIVEPSLFRKVTSETDEERISRYYSSGKRWLEKRNERIKKAQEEEKNRKVPHLKSKAEWDEWLARRSKPLERDRIAAENAPIVRVIGSLAPAPKEESAK